MDIYDISVSENRKRIFNIILEEACRQWCVFIDEASERKDGKGFADFFYEIFSEKEAGYITEQRESEAIKLRKNAGYIITNSITIGDSEIVLGVHETRPNDFVTWECSDKNNYYWGHYFSSLLDAQKDFCERGLNKVKFYEQIGG